jgi:hypothetical protein
MAMEAKRTVFGRAQQCLARALVRRSATPLILAGTLALAGFGAASLGSTPSTSITPVPIVTTPPVPAYPSSCFPDPDGDGHTVCYLTQSQMQTPNYAGGYCHPDPDGDGHFVCYFASNPNFQ